MSANTAAHILTSVHPTKSSDYNYPAAAYYEEMNADNGIKFHNIYYAGAPGVLFANAPNGSTLTDTTNGNAYIKRGTIGLIDGTWGYGAETT